MQKRNRNKVKQQSRYGYEPNGMTNIDVELDQPEKKKKMRAFRLHKVNVIAISAVFAVGTLFMLFGKRPTISAEEKRELTKRPAFTIESYLDGTFTSQFSAFFNDTVPLRSDFKHMIAVFRSRLGVDFDDVEIVGQIPVQEVKPSETAPPTEPATARETLRLEQPATETETVTETEEPEDENLDGEVANNILIVKDRGVLLYGGGYSVGEQYAKTLNEYKKRLGNDVNVYSLIAPTTASYYLPKKYQSMSASEQDNIEHVNSFFEDVTPVDAYNVLLAHKNEPIYSRTDHHWAALGAFYAAEEFAKTANVPFAPLRNYNEVSREGYVGTLYGFTGSSKLKDNPETFTYYEPKSRYTCTYYNTDMTGEREKPLLIDLDGVDPADWYLVFMGGDERVTYLETECKNHRTLCIIKDSYGNALVPVLTSSFEEIWVVDMRYFQPNIIRFMQDKGVTDVLFCMNTFSATGGNSRHLQTLMNQ